MEGYSMEAYYLVLYFFVYGFFGWCTEVAYAAVKEHRFVNRGFLNGPVCPIYGVGVTVVIASLSRYKENLFVLFVSSVILVTLLEGITGWAMDKIFHNKWWDYSGRPFNIGGYVCLPFSLIWGGACVVVMDFIHPLLHRLLAFLPQTIGVILIIVMGAAMVADLYVTAAAIFRFNKRLARMDKVAFELHQISQQLGEDIYEKVVLAMEKQEVSRQKLGESAAGLKEKTQETAAGLKEKAQEAASEFMGRTQEAAFGIKEKTQEAASGFMGRTQEAASGIKEKTQEAAAGIKERGQEVSGELRNRIGDLKRVYLELGSKTPRINRRLVKAFPRMESRKHKLQLEEFHKRFGGKHKKTERSKH